MVYIASPNTVPAEPVSDHIRAYWLATEHNAGTRGGFAGILEFDAGAREPLHRHSGNERAMVVLAGEAVVLTVDGERPAPKGTIIFAPYGVWHGLVAVNGPLTVLDVYGGDASFPAALLTDVWDGTEPGGEQPLFLHVDDSDEVVLHDPTRALFHMTGRRFIDSELIGSSALMLGYAGYDPEGGAHEFHRHRLADEFVYILEGEGIHLDGEQEIPMKSGELAHVPGGEWHGIRNSGDVPLRVLFGFLGVGDPNRRGYEVREPTTTGRN